MPCGCPPIVLTASVAGMPDAIASASEPEESEASCG